MIQFILKIGITLQLKWLKTYIWFMMSILCTKYIYISIISKEGQFIVVKPYFISKNKYGCFCINWWCVTLWYLCQIVIVWEFKNALICWWIVHHFGTTWFNLYCLIFFIQKFGAKFSILLVLVLELLHHKLVELGKITCDNNIKISKEFFNAYLSLILIKY